MILAALILVPLLSGAALWAWGPRSRSALGAGAGLALLVTMVLAALAAPLAPTLALSWGAGLAPSLAAPNPVPVMTVGVPLVALCVVAWGAAHEEIEQLPRLVGLLVAFVGAMELLVLAADLLSLIVGWELVGAISWALIGHHTREREATDGAIYAFVATRLGGLGLFVAAGAAWASAGSLSFSVLPAVARGPWGNALVAGLFVAAISKSGLVPFSPWLYRAMQGPTAVSALLHSSTMVAAGAWLVIRLADVLHAAPWFGPAAIAFGLVTAFMGGIAALAQGHAKRLLAASTSAHYGLMFVAVGAGSAAAGLTHLAMHALFKALLFLTAGTALGAVKSPRLADMRLGRALPGVAGATAVGALALGAAPPLGGAWSKEQVVAAAGHAAPWLGLLTVGAGALSAAYGVRFFLGAYGTRGAFETRAIRRPGPVERGAPWILAALCLVSGLLWLEPVHAVLQPVLPGELPEGKAWELAASVLLVALAAYGTFAADRAGRFETPLGPRAVKDDGLVADWWGLPRLIAAGLTRPALEGARILARFDDRVVDAGVRAAAAVGRAGARALSAVAEASVDGAVMASARLALRGADGARVADERGIDRGVDGLAGGVGHAGRDARGLQDGAVPTYYAIVVVGLATLALVLALGS